MRLREVGRDLDEVDGEEGHVRGFWYKPSAGPGRLRSWPKTVAPIENRFGRRKRERNHNQGLGKCEAAELGKYQKPVDAGEAQCNV